MSFPLINTTSESIEDTDTTTHNFVIPTGAAIGDLMVLKSSVDGTATISAMQSGWTKLFEVSAGAGGTGHAWWKKHDGSESNGTYTTSVAQKSVNLVSLVKANNWHGTTAPESADDGGYSSTTTPDPPNLAPSWGLEDNLYIAMFAHDARGTTSVYPTNYDDNQTSVETAAGGGGCMLGFATRELGATSDNPGTFTVSFSESGVAATICIRPKPPFTTPIDIDNTGGSSQTDFPVQVDLNSSNFDFEKIDSTGKNIRFELADKTILDHWLESFDAVAKTATYWVEIPTLGVEVLTITAFHNSVGGVDTSSGADTFTYFEDFINSVTGHLPYGGDAAFTTVFDPVSRRLYRFGVDANASGDGPNLVQWYNVDTEEVGFEYPGLDTHLADTLAIYNATEKKIYLYGGRLVGGSPRTDKIQSFDPATHTFATLTETLPGLQSAMSGIYHPASGDNYLFGGIQVSTYQDAILVHDIGAGTVTDTTANLPSASAAHTAIWSVSESRVYIVGGLLSSGANLTSIWKYDPASESTDPTVLTSVLTAESENQGLAFDNDGVNLYIFGGVDRSVPTYQDAIQKLVVSTDSISTLSATLPRGDDDLVALYDATNDRIYVGPILHSDQATDNKSEEKFIILVFNPNDDTMGSEPTIGTTPTGWSEVGNSVEGSKGRAINGTYLTIADRETAKFVGVRDDFTAITSGVYMFESRVDTPADGDVQVRLAHSANFITILGPNSGSNWQMEYSGPTNQTIAALANGYQILGCLMDIDNQKIFGLLDRGSKTVERAFRSASATQLDRIQINASTAKREAIVVDWLLVRKSTTGTEPVVTVQGVIGRIMGSLAAAGGLAGAGGIAGSGGGVAG